MTRYIFGRVGQAGLVLWASFTLCFLLMQALPGDAILIKFQSPDLGLSAAQIADIRAAYGADSPMWLQYLHTLGHFLTGNFGYSVQAGVPVKDQLITSLPTTLWLAGTAFALALAIAAVIAILSTLSVRPWLRAAIRTVPALFISLPTFWLGIVLIQIISFRLRLISVIAPGPWEGLVLPATTLAVTIAAPLAQILIRSIDEVLTEPFVPVVRAKGASRAWVLRKHVVRNAMLPTLTIAGILLGQLIGGAVVTETVFGLNGIGSLVQQAVSNQDLSVLQAIVVLSTTAFVVINLTVDLLYPVLDPRLRKQIGAAA